MVTQLKVDSDDLWEMSSRVTAIADDLHSHPFVNVGGVSGCGSAMVANAAEAANSHFALRALLMEDELRNAAAMARNVAAVVERTEEMMASPGEVRGLPTGGNVIV